MSSESMRRIKPVDMNTFLDAVDTSVTVGREAIVGGVRTVYENGFEDWVYDEDTHEMKSNFYVMEHVQ